MESATSCCWAPSCRLRSILRRSSSCASTSRRREALSSSIVACSSAVSRPLRKTSPAWEARCCKSLSSAWVSDSFLGLCRASAPSSSSPCRTATARDAASKAGSLLAVGQRERSPGREDPSGQIVTGRSSGPDPDPGLRPDGAGGAGQDGHHLGDRLVVVQLPGHVVGEVGQHLVGRGPLPVHQPVGDPAGPLPSGLEQQGDRDGRGDRQHRAALLPGERPDAQHDPGVHGGQPGRDQAVDDGPVDDDVDLVQPVLQDPDRDRGREARAGR